MIDERYLYEIHPHRPIKNLIPGRAIVKPCSMKLTKSEVVICMNGGPVFRLFPGKDPIRVIGSNLDQLHVSKFEEYEILTKPSNQTINDEKCTRVEEGVAEEPKTEAPTAPIVSENTPITETENIPEELKNLVNNEETMYEVTTDILVSSVTNKKATVSVQAEFPAGSSVEDVIRIKEEAAEELKEKSAEKMKELDTPDPEPEEEVKEEPIEIPFEEAEAVASEEVTTEEDSQEDETEDEEEVETEEPTTEHRQNPVSVNVYNGKKHKKNRH